MMAWKSGVNSVRTLVTRAYTRPHDDALRKANKLLLLISAYKRNTCNKPNHMCPLPVKVLNALKSFGVQSDNFKKVQE
jgi:hypothetical protein